VVSAAHTEAQIRTTVRALAEEIDRINPAHRSGAKVVSSHG